MFQICWKTARNITPPVIWHFYYAIRRNLDNHNTDKLFNGDDRLFKSILNNTDIYGEYGCGKSTTWVLNNTKAKVYSVDTDKNWINYIRNRVIDDKRLTTKWINVGDLGRWGTPLSYSHRDNFHIYTDFLWQREHKPTVVLIDGRFRVCCFLTTLKYADKGTKILFDDYAEREQYHVVEEFVKPIESCGRQYLFVVPSSDTINYSLLNEYIEKFRFVVL